MEKLLHILLPRFITEDVALLYKDGEYMILCALKDIGEFDNYEATATARSFNLLGIGLFPSFTDVKFKNP